jgi:hypothetical protein
LFPGLTGFIYLEPEEHIEQAEHDEHPEQLPQHPLPFFLALCEAATAQTIPAATAASII